MARRGAPGGVDTFNSNVQPGSTLMDNIDFNSSHYSFYKMDIFLYIEKFQFFSSLPCPSHQLMDGTIIKKLCDNLNHRPVDYLKNIIQIFKNKLLRPPGDLGLL